MRRRPHRRSARRPPGHRIRRLVPAGVAAVAMGAAVAGCAGGAATARPDDPPTVGVLRAVSDDDHGAIVDELRRQGWTVGDDVVLLPRDQDQTYADVDEAREALARWERDGLELVIAFSTPFAQLAVERSDDVPGLFVVNDPVVAGLVDDPGHPDRGMSGVTFRTPADRTLDLAADVVGGLRVVGYLGPSDDPGVPGHRAAILAAADELDVEVVEASFSGSDDVAAAVAELAGAGVEAVFVANSTATYAAVDELRAAFRSHRLPAISNTDVLDFAVLVLTPDGAELRRQLARQAARILGGADVSSVPVEDPRKFEVIINRTEAERLGLAPIAADVLRQADVVR